MSLIIILGILLVMSLSKGDTSLLIALGKIALGIALFILVGAILTQPTLLVTVLILIAVGAVVYYLYKKFDTNTDDNTAEQPNQPQKPQPTPTNDALSSTPTKQNTNTLLQPRTAFQDELSQQTKTPQQAHDEEIARQKADLDSKIKTTYGYIKNRLTDAAKSGQYILNDGKKNIAIEYELYELKTFIGTKINPKYTPPSTWSNMHPMRQDSQTYYIKDDILFHYYLTKLQKLAETDGISIYLFYRYEDSLYGNQTFQNLPCTLRGFMLNKTKFKPYIRCNITY